MGGLRHTPLHSRHVAAGARMVGFAGFEMPVLYGSIVEEHRAVRARAGLFDVSHMGEIRLRGPGALDFAQLLFTNDVAGARNGQVRYGLLCAEDGGAIDDVTLYRCGDAEALLCVNAANAGADLAWIREVHAKRRPDCAVLDESEATALLAVQGPEARGLVDGLRPPGARPVGRWRFREDSVAGVPALLSRTGYTGEDGYEIFVERERACELWDALVAAGGGRLALAGLGARDTLRTEMAYPLYGHELDREHDPLEAGLERFLAFGRGFLGEEALARHRERGVERRLVGFTLEGRQVPRPGYRILADGPVGVVTSGTFGPSVERSIGIGYVGAGHARAGTLLHVEIRGRPVPCEVTPTPFFSRKEG